MPEPTQEPDQRRVIERPGIRGILNGVVFAIALMASQSYGLFDKARSLTQDDVAQHVLTGLVFGFAMYVYATWSGRRRTRALDAAAKVRALNNDGDASAEEAGDAPEKKE
jgi:hypothetical protein